MKLIECFSHVRGKQSAQKLLTELNEIKNDDQTVFSIREVRQNVFVVDGKVTQKDWENLNLVSDFMRF